MKRVTVTEDGRELFDSEVVKAIIYVRRDDDTCQVYASRGSSNIDVALMLTVLDHDADDHMMITNVLTDYLEHRLDYQDALGKAEN